MTSDTRTGALRRTASRGVLALVLAVVAALLPTTGYAAADPTPVSATGVTAPTITAALSDRDKSVPLTGMGVAYGDAAATIAVEIYTSTGTLSVPEPLRSRLQLNGGSWEGFDTLKLKAPRADLDVALPQIRLHGSGTREGAFVTIFSGSRGANSDRIPMGEQPSAPRWLEETRNTTSTLQVGFTAPEDDGGLPNASYTATATRVGTDDSVSAQCAELHCTFLRLVGSSAYDVVVTVGTGLGRGPSSEPLRVTTAPGIPAPVTDLAAAPRDASAELTWSAPSWNGGSAITGYDYARAPRPGDDGDPDWSFTTQRSKLITHLTNGTSTTLLVRAVNEHGPSAPQSVTVTPVAATVPAAPSAAGVTAGDGKVTVTYSAPPVDGGSPVTGYEVVATRTDIGTVAKRTTCTASPCTVDGLVNGFGLKVTVAATNAVGTGPTTTAGTATPRTVPGAPGLATAGSTRSAVLVISPPRSDGGSPVTGYQYAIGDDTTWHDLSTNVEDGGSARGFVLGLADGTTYSFRVRAVSDAGASPASPTVMATTHDVPGVVRDLAAVAGDGSATLSFGAPASDGGRPVQRYQYSLDGTSWTSFGNVRTVTLDGLTNGTAYLVRVRAVSTVGDGAATSQSVTPRAPAQIPGQVGSVVTAPGDGRATVTFAAPASDGGSAVLDYTVVATPPGPGSPVTTACTGSPCVVAGLVNSTTYAVTVAARNAVGTGTPSAPVAVEPVAPTVAPGKPSPAPTTSTTPGTPTGLAGVGGDRVLTFSWDEPTGSAPVSGYEVSLDGGAWAPVTSLAGSRPTAALRGLRNGQTYAVRVRAVNGTVTGPATSAVAVPLAQWFADPVSAATRAKLLAVPAKPSRYRGPARVTKAAATAQDGSPVMALAALRGRQLQSGQGATMLDGAMFSRGTASLTPRGLTQVRGLVASLRQTTAVRCEGHTDVSGVERRRKGLSLARAKTVCDTLVRLGATVRTTTTGHGSTRPVVVGGSAADRAANRRVVVEVTGG